jgi:hypothetical protein
MIIETREVPCGNCNCGTYSMESSMNKNARKFGALEEKEREKSIPMCKKEPHLKCAGDTDFHLALIKLDESIEKKIYQNIKNK